MAHHSHAHPTLSPETRYIEVPPTSGGWQSMVKTVIDQDEAKIKDTKEDIDTLLVFAGLFSAVESAFLLESYKALSPDTESQMLAVLQRIANQNYTFAGGMLNVTTPLNPATPAAFEAPLWAVRVNGLWFASLIVSLAAASLGILVKSWLREYLAGAWFSPKARLRARQYRRPALARWRVFEIAAALPLLLQLALGLFFVGLCFFTASVDPRMGRTALPLVAAWAFFLSATALAPLVSPRCPFKIAFLRTPLRIARRTVVPLLVSVSRSIWRLCSLNTLLSWIIDGPLKETPGRLAGKITLYFPSFTEGRDKLGLAEEEEVAVAGVQDDAQMLLSLDAILGDDSILQSMWGAFRQSKLEPEQEVAFVLSLISHRIGKDATLQGTPKILDLTPLDRTGYHALMEMLTDTIRTHGVGLPSAHAPQWMLQATGYLLSPSSHSLPDAAILVLGTVLSHSQKTGCPSRQLGQYLKPDMLRGETYTPLAPSLGAVYAHRARPELIAPQHLYAALLDDAFVFDAQGSSELPVLLWQNTEVFDAPAARPVLDDLWTFLARALQWELHHGPGAASRHGGIQALMLLMDYGRRMGRDAEAAVLLRKLWATHHLTSQAITLVAAVQRQGRVDDEEVMNLVIKAFLQENAGVCQKILHNSGAIIFHICSDKHDDWNKHDPVDFIRCSRIFLKLYVEYCSRTSYPKDHQNQHSHDPRESHILHSDEHTNSLKNEWSILWYHIHQALQRYMSKKIWLTPHREDGSRSFYKEFLPVLSGEEVLEEDRVMAQECVGLMDVVAELEKSGRSDARVFPQDFRLALEMFVNSKIENDDSAH